MKIIYSNFKYRNSVPSSQQFWIAPFENFSRNPEFLQMKESCVEPGHFATTSVNTICASHTAWTLIECPPYTKRI